MESYKCRVCSKRFVNGRALGGHMRSHRLSVDEEEEQVERASQLSDENESHVSSSSSDRKRNGLRKNDPRLTFNGSALLEDDESETEPSRNINNLTRIRSKRTGKLEVFATKKVKTSQVGYKTEPELEPPHSSASDTTTEEDLAFCLMMLSRDEWKKNNKEVVEEIEKEESKGYNKSSKINRTTTKGRYKCETCEKVFKSYQALGGHRASHKKNRVCIKTEYDNVVVVDAAEKRIHECPICLRVFASGQALGGHKRSHGVGNLSINYQVDRIEPVKQMMIDLNLPAPNEEDDVSVVFQ